MDDLRLGVFETVDNYGRVLYIVALESESAGLIFADTVDSYDEAYALAELVAALFDMAHIEQ